MTENKSPLDSQSHIDESNNTDKSLSSPTMKSKNYRIKNNEWHCRICSIYCNSTLQFEMHLVSQKHKIIDLERKARRDSCSLSVTEASHEPSNSKVEFYPSKECDVSNGAITMKEECATLNPDENNNNSFQTQSLVTITNQNQRSSNVRIKSSYSPIEISQNLIAIKFNVNAEKYLIPENKKNGKFEKFGFYCSLCNAYMTGQIQLIMHVKGARHQFFSPNEIPGYKSSKLFNPNQYLGSQKQKHDREQMQQPKFRQQYSDKNKTPSVVNHVNEIKINNYTSTIAPAFSHGVVNSGGGTYYDYLVRNEALMYGGQNHNHSHQHHHHHHHQRGIFNPSPSLNQITSVSGVNANYQVNGQSLSIDYYNQHHHHHHSSIYLTPSLLRQQQPHQSKYLQLPTLLQYATPQQQHLSPQVASNYGGYVNEPSSQAQISFQHQQTPPPPPPSASSLSTSQENLTTTTPVSTYQIPQSNSVSDQYRKEVPQNCSNVTMTARLKSRFSNNTNSDKSLNVFKDLTNTKRDDTGYYFNQNHQFQHHTPQYTSNGVSIIPTKPSGIFSSAMNQVHHHVLPQQHHQSQCNFYFNSQVPSTSGNNTNLNELVANQATSY